MLKIALIVVGLAMVLVAFAWRARELRRRSGGIDSALRDPDPATRTRALREIASVGLRPWAKLLLARAAEVAPGQEADELVWLIGACQWEPADDPAIVQLRLWAARHHDAALGDRETAAAPPPASAPAAPPTPIRAHLRAAPVPPESLIPKTVTPQPLAPEPPLPDPGTDEALPATAEARARPAFVDEIEEIVGAPVTFVTFVPLRRTA